MTKKTEERLTSAEIKKQIEEATKTQKEESKKSEIKDSGLPLTGQLANEINANSTTEEKQKTESKPEEPKAPAEKVTEQSVDSKEWAKKKWNIDGNFDSAEEILQALRKRDQDWHEKHIKDIAKAKEMAPQQPSYQPPPFQVYMPQNGYQPQNPIIENIARQYNMTVEDVQRLAAFNRDFFETLMAQERIKAKQDIEELKRDTAKNNVFRELSSDPLFKRPDVAIEYHNVLDQMQTTDPASFENDPFQYRRAFDTALQRLGRRYLEGRPLVEGSTPIPMTPPTIPPKNYGQGSGGGYKENENEIDPQAFAKLSLDEKRKFLESRGLISTY